jgi:hypothetical protein
MAQQILQQCYILSGNIDKTYAILFFKKAYLKQIFIISTSASWQKGALQDEEYF